MNSEIGLIFRLINGLVTLYLVLILYKIYENSRKRFYLYWSLGYLAYGLNILVRLFLPEGFDITPLGIAVFILAYTGFTFMLVGIDELIKRPRMLLLISFFFPAGLAFVAVLGLTSGYLVVFTALIPYFLIAVSLLAIQVSTGLNLRLLTFGWILLLLINVVYIMELVDPGFIDLFSTFGKIVIFGGMTQPQFSYLDEDLKLFFIKGFQREYVDSSLDGKIILLNLKKSKTEEINWIRDRVKSNSRKGIRTILFTYYDMISPKAIITEETKDDLFVIRVLPGKNKSRTAFEEQLISIEDDVNQIDLFFSDIIEYSNERRIPCEIILYSLSFLIHTHGWKRVYTFMTSKNAALKTSQVQLLAFYSPETHESQSDILKFESLADQII